MSESTVEFVYCTGCHADFNFVDTGYIRKDLCVYCEDSLVPYDLGE